MRKTSKKYRKLQREKNLKKQIFFAYDIDQEVDGMNTSNLAIAQIVEDNPIVFDKEETKMLYMELLNKYLKVGVWNKRKYVSSEIEAYRKILFENREVRHEYPIEYYQYFILFDILHLLVYETLKIPKSKFDNIIYQHAKDFENADSAIVQKIINSVKGDNKRLVNLMKNEALSKEKHYLELIRKNVMFKRSKPFGVMVTATMSAGKSTFINSLIGKYICLSQNMACTSKIHSIINKPFEDGYSSEYDHDLVMTAGREELLNDNEDNLSDVIFVATNFMGKLSDSRIIVNDSPGVNFSGDEEHQKVANKLIKKRNYGLLIYVMNATQLGTNDESTHLDFVKQTIGRTPIMFVMNKVDSFNPDEENIEDIIQRQKEYLINKGFKNPMICPMSARAGYLAKQYQQGKLGRSEERELYNYVDKFEKMKLYEYYKRVFPTVKIADCEQEEEQLLKNCGLSYIESIINGYVKGGN